MLIAESMSCCICLCTSMLSRYDVPILVAATLPRCAGGLRACGERETFPDADADAELDIDRWWTGDGRVGSIWICLGDEGGGDVLRAGGLVGIVLVGKGGVDGNEGGVKAVCGGRKGELAREAICGGKLFAKGYVGSVRVAK